MILNSHHKDQLSADNTINTPSDGKNCNHKFNWLAAFRCSDVMCEIARLSIVHFILPSERRHTSFFVTKNESEGKHLF